MAKRRAKSTSQPSFSKVAEATYRREVDALAEKASDRAWKAALFQHWDKRAGRLFPRFSWDDVEMVAMQFAHSLAYDAALRFIGAETPRPSLERTGLVVAASPALSEGELDKGTFPMPPGKYHDARLLMADAAALAMAHDISDATQERIGDLRASVEREQARAARTG